MIVVAPITLREANAFVSQHHTHNGPSRGHRFSVCARVDGELVGVAICGRPVARHLDDGLTTEVLRVCTDGVERRTADRRGEQHTLPVNSTLYDRCARIWRAWGGHSLITYTLQTEEAKALRALGWRIVAEVSGEASWSRVGRERAPAEIYALPKHRWEIAA